MTTVLRMAVALVLALAAFPASARGLAGNGCGDGEANVPFDGLVIDADDLGGGSGELGAAGLAVVYAPARNPASNGVGDGEANVPFEGMQMAASDELGGGSGEPGRTAEDPAARAEREREFEQHVWTDP